MAISPGDQFDTFEILGPLGSGGMGEVYRARDRKLERDVAIKVLPEDFANDPGRLARFEREAKALAALNHPNVATVHGFEQDGETHFLVMELVPGEDLAERIRRGPIAIDEAIALFLQIAEGLEAAHAKALLHRDLKPANVMVTPSGSVKILDFGLAKAVAAISSESPDLSHSPTMTAMATQRGEILGTAAYMAPEQAEGRAVDHRADIWAFGVCLFEALTGRRPFDGENPSSMIAAVLRDEPDWTVLPQGLPAEIERLLRRCLTRKAEDRLQAIGDARLELKDATESRNRVAELSPARRSSRWLWAAVALVPLALAAAYLAGRGATSSPPAEVLLFEFDLPADAPLTAQLGNRLAISPDGSRIVWTGYSNERDQLFARDVESLEVLPIEGTAGGRAPFFSADGRWIAFWASGELRRVEARGGVPETLATIPDLLGGHWSSAGEIVVNDGQRWLTIPDSGAEPQLIVDQGKVQQWLGEELAFLESSGQMTSAGLLFVAHTGTNENWICLISLGEGLHRLVVGDSVRLSADEATLYLSRGESLYSAKVDLRQRTVGEPRLELEGVDRNFAKSADLAIAGDGTLAWAPAGGGRSGDVVLFDPQGYPKHRVRLSSSHLEGPRLSPDGTRLAISERGQGQAHETSITLVDLGRGETGRTVSGDIYGWEPVWSPDGRSLYFVGQDDDFRVFEKQVDSPTPPTPVASLPIQASDAFASDVSSDGRWLLVGISQLGARFKMWLLDLDDPSRWRQLGDSDVAEAFARFSPDLRWITFARMEDSRWQVFARSFPDPDLEIPVSSEGGTDPYWSADGQTIYYRRGPAVYRASLVEGSDPLRFGPEERVFTGTFRGGALYFDYNSRTETFVLVEPRYEQRARIRVARGLLSR